MASGGREPIHYYAMTLGMQGFVLLSSASAFFGALASLSGAPIPSWIKVLIVVVVLLVAVWACAHALRARTSITDDHVEHVNAFSSWAVPWTAIGAVEPTAGGVAVLVDGEWLYLHSAPDPEEQFRAVVSRWTARRGRSWQPPDQLPPTPRQIAAQRRLEDQEQERATLRGWWQVPAWVTGLFVTPVSFALAEGIGLRAAVTVIGCAFVGFGAVAVAVRLVTITRSAAAIRPIPVVLALAVLAAVAAVTYTAWSAIPV